MYQRTYSLKSKDFVKQRNEHSSNQERVELNESFNERKRNFYKEIESLRQENNSLILKQDYNVRPQLYSLQDDRQFLKNEFNRSDGHRDTVEELRGRLRDAKIQLHDSSEREIQKDTYIKQIEQKNKNLLNQNEYFQKQIREMQLEIFNLKKEVNRKPLYTLQNQYVNDSFNSTLEQHHNELLSERDFGENIQEMNFLFKK